MSNQTNDHEMKNRQSPNHKQGSGTEFYQKYNIEGYGEPDPNAKSLSKINNSNNH